jgi:hypothetical protein
VDRIEYILVRCDRIRLDLRISVFKDGGVSVDSEPPDLLNVVGPCRGYERPLLLLLHLTPASFVPCPVFAQEEEVNGVQ